VVAVNRARIVYEAPRVAAKPGETVTAVVLRDGKETRLETTLQEAKGPR